MIESATSHHFENTTWVTRTQIDPAPGDQNDPIPYDAVDEDHDNVPDDVEPSCNDARDDDHPPSA